MVLEDAARKALEKSSKVSSEPRKAVGALRGGDAAHPALGGQIGVDLILFPGVIGALDHEAGVPDRVDRGGATLLGRGGSTMFGQHSRAEAEARGDSRGAGAAAARYGGSRSVRRFLPPSGGVDGGASSPSRAVFSATPARNARGRRSVREDVINGISCLGPARNQRRGDEGEQLVVEVAWGQGKSRRGAPKWAWLAWGLWSVLWAPAVELGP